jgi:5-deoxy-D-glucuronate isomerase
MHLMRVSFSIGDRLEVEAEMARKTIFVSDLSGNEIEEKKAAKVTITYADARRGQVVLDVNEDEVADLAAKGQKQARRGRRPKKLA